jgi:hypothetical protein
MTATPAGGNTPFLPSFRNLSVDDEQFRIVVSQWLTQAAYCVNVKQFGHYELVELLAGQQFSVANDAQKKRPVFRIIFYINPSNLTFNHGITGITLFTNIYGVITTSTAWYPLPLVDVVNVTNQIAINVTTTQVIITPGATAPTITGGVVVLEYVKN